MAKRIPKHITKKEDIDFILNIDESKVTLSTMMEMFAEFNNVQRFHPYDTFEIPIGSYGKGNKKNKNIVTTTVGIWIFNRFFIENDLLDTFGYLNYEFNKKKWNKLTEDITELVLEDKLELDILDRLLQKSQKVMPITDVLSPSVTEKFLNVSNYIEPKKAELAKKYKKEIEEGDPVIAEKMEKELIDYALNYLGDDPSLDLYLSGARSNIGNHFKNMYIMKGAIRNPDPNAKKQFDIALSNYNNGISKEEYAIFCNSLAAGPYKRSNRTEIGGKWEKLLVKAFEHIQLEPEGSDCRTKDYIELVLTEDYLNGFMYSYIIEKDGLVELNSTNKNKYLNKKVKLRFAGLCDHAKDGNICNKCMGNLPYKLNVKNVGVAMGILGSILKNKSMKAFHDSVETIFEMDVKKAFGE